MTTRFGSLRDEDICAAIGRLFCHAKCLNPANKKCADALDRIDKRPHVTEGKHDGRWSVLQRKIQQLRTKIFGEPPF